MSNPADPSPVPPPADEVIVTAESDPLAYLEQDSPEVRSLDLDLDLDVFDAETGDRAPQAAAVPQGDAPAESKTVSRMSGPPEVMSGPAQSSAQLFQPRLRPWEGAGETPRTKTRPVAGVLGLAAVAGVFWMVTAYQGARTVEIPEAATTSQLAPATEPVSAPESAAPAATNPITASPAVRPAATAEPPPLAGTIPVRAPAPVVVPPSEAGMVAAGWLKVEAPIDLDISTEGRVVGTSRSDRTMLASGRYDLLLANERIGFTTRQSVTILPGQLRTLRIQIPGGQASFNARPWANVVVDGMDVGETPLGNLPLSAGVHQVVFSHPELGQRRVEAVVQAGQHLRLNVDFRAP